MYVFLAPSVCVLFKNMVTISLACQKNNIDSLVLWNTHVIKFNCLKCNFFFLSNLLENPIRSEKCKWLACVLESAYSSSSLFPHLDFAVTLLVSFNRFLYPLWFLLNMYRSRGVFGFRFSGKIVQCMLSSGHTSCLVVPLDVAAINSSKVGKWWWSNPTMPSLCNTWNNALKRNKLICYLVIQSYNLYWKKD